MKLSPSLALLASTFALIAGCKSSDTTDADDTVTGGQETTAPEMSTAVSPSVSNTSPSPTNTGSAQPTTTTTTTATNTGNPTPTTDPTTDDTSPPGPTASNTNDGIGGAGSDDPTSDPGDDTTTDDSATDETSDETDPTSDETTDEMTDETDPTSDETTDETDATSEPPDVGACSAVIQGELTDCADPTEADPNFSFFVASRLSMVALSGNPLGFGGNLGGLECADTVCALIAECVAPANGKTWHAFLSTSEVDAKDRIGSGPWHDVVGTKIADDLSGLIGVDRPTTSDGVVNHNLPNEFGCENLTPACDDVKEDNHHTMTGSNEDGTYVEGHTCNDWTSSEATPGEGPAVGLAWERSLLFGGGGGGGGGGAVHWLNFENESGCGPGGNLDNNPPMGNNDGSVGSGGGYGAIYCFAVTE